MFDFNNIKNGETLTKKQFDEIMTEITKHHRFGGRYGQKKEGGVCRYIKYIRPSWDMRDLKCFFITFDEKEFDFRESDDSMFNCIMNWLNEKGEANDENQV